MTLSKKNSIVALLLALSLVCFAGIASAHVTVQPKQTTQGAYEVFSVRVPSEKDGVQTTKVKVRVPDGVNVSRTEPKPEWTAELEKGADGKIVSVTWTVAAGKGLASTEFTEFRLTGKVADNVTELGWKAYQTYSDNSTVDWVGAKDSDYPASVTAVTAGTGAGDGHGGTAGSGAQSGTAAADESAQTGTAAAGGNAAAESGSAAAGAGEASGSKVPLYLSIAALILGAAALITAISGRRKR
ncbi:YcnI family protein [Paenibacillus beijingensis]|uniref:YncI copper-binding domain-containing protein n=1 Tax=Paenibacillus beijingensis TaxID=1126833 RepID=A0A0D5NE78_9BACL|nr:YcnI family protein [Paenibacillus beijingensis]AJY73669.1 hypothetical protein VN24_02265 [Paenibacillus beijingensis]